MIDASPYDGPPATARITQSRVDATASTVQVDIRCPSGGWTLARDDNAVAAGIAKLFYTLERPAENEMVTHALVTLSDRFEAGDESFARAEIYIHLAQRGVQTLTTNYRLAAKANE